MSTSLPPELSAFRTRHPDIAAVDVLLPDLCGTLSDKRVSVDELAKVWADGVAFPGCSFAVDITGETIEATGLSIDRGVPDRPCLPVAGTLAPVPWAAKPVGQVLLAMRDADGGPFPLAPRTLVQKLVAELATAGLVPVLAVELEFYLIDADRQPSDPPRPPRSPVTGQVHDRTKVYALDGLEDFADLVDDITAAARAQGIPAGTAIAEYGPAQYEVTLAHRPDALRAADDAVLFKRAVKGVAQRHGFAATFMAKPYPGQASSGMHVHMSLLDRDGRNVFTSNDPAGSPLLRHAVGGMMEALPACMALVAPGANSWRRFVPGSYAPTTACWGVDNRTVALRVPAGPPASRRVEFRIAGADANPYLVVAAMLAGLLEGLERRLDPGPPTAGNAYAAPRPDGTPLLPATWEEALAAFAASDILRRRLGPEFCRIWRTVKLAERDKFVAQVTPLEIAWYLRSA